MLCAHCHHEFKDEYAEPRNGVAFCPTCLKEALRQDELECRQCGHKAQVFFTEKRTCYSIRWCCPVCNSNDVIDPDCVPTVDEQEYEVV